MLVLPGPILTSCFGADEARHNRHIGPYALEGRLAVSCTLACIGTWCACSVAEAAHTALYHGHPAQSMYAETRAGQIMPQLNLEAARHVLATAMCSVQHC